MSRPAPVGGRRSAAWLIILAGLFVFVLGIWMRRAAGPQATELEALIAANEPEEHVHALAVTPDGSVHVGTHLGLIAGSGKSGWKRVADLTVDVLTLQPAGADGLYLGGHEIGLSRYTGGRLQRLLAERVQALAVDPRSPDRLVAYATDSGLHESRDGGRTWSRLAGWNGPEILALAIDPRDPTLLMAGGVGGYLAYSTDGGRRWTPSGLLQGSVSALLFDPRPPHRLWAAAGGAVLFSEDLSVTWHKAPRTAGERMAVALTFDPEGRLTGITTEGYLFVQSDQQKR